MWLHSDFCFGVTSFWIPMDVCVLWDGRRTAVEQGQQNKVTRKGLMGLHAVLMTVAEMRINIDVFLWQAPLSQWCTVARCPYVAAIVPGFCLCCQQVLNISLALFGSLRHHEYGVYRPRGSSFGMTCVSVNYKVARISHAGQAPSVTVPISLFYVLPVTLLGYCRVITHGNSQTNV